MAVYDNLNYSYSPGVAPSVVQYYDRAVPPNMKPEMVHNRDAQKRTLPKHNGKTVQFRRITALPAITTPLIEGVTPEGQTMHETSFTAMVKPYGGHIEVTDELDFYLLGPKHKEAADTLADQAALSLDTISRNALNAGMNVQYAGSNTSRGTVTSNDKLTYLDIKKAVRTLRRANAKPFPDGFFHGVTHTDVYFDLTSDPMWVDVAKYQDKQKVEKYELGTIYKCKLFESTNAMVFKPQTYIYGSVTQIAASAAYNVAERYMTTTATISPDDARALTGLLVNVQYSSGGSNVVTPMCIEKVDYKQGRIYFRWDVATAISDNWTTGNSLKIVPYGGGANGGDVYSTLVYAADSYGSIELEGGGRNVRIIVHAPGHGEDPLEQRGTIAWKVEGFCTVILQDDFIVRIESGATA